MTVLNQKLSSSKPVSWISYSKDVEIQQKRVLSPTYANLYHYGANNPVRYIDPDGRADSDDIMSQIKTLQAEMADWESKGGGITSEQFSAFMSLAGQYNNSLIKEGNLNISDYVSNGTITTAFDEAQDAVGNYQVNFHNGIDVVGGDLKSPFFMIATGGNEKGSNTKIFSIVGTDLKMKVLHGDAGSVAKTGDFFSPGGMIMPFPKKNNFQNASTAPHFHIELSNGSKFVNPFTLKTSNTNYQRTLDGGKTWNPIRPNF